MVELNRAYEDGALRVKGNYSAFLEAEELYLHAQKKRQESLENRVHTELEWLRRGPKARATKAKARIDKAHGMIGELAEMNARSRTTSAEIDFSATNRKTKQLITLEGVSYDIGSRTLFKDIHFSVTSGMRVGLVGPNGSGKTTLLRLLRGDIKPESGKIRRADGLRIVYFDQNRELDPDSTLRRALAPDSDAVIYQERVIHVAAWAERFLFSAENLNQRVGRLSGGERARVLIAQLMLQPADVLLLDEPTNDLDIPTLDSMAVEARSVLLITRNGTRGSARSWQRLPPGQRMETGALALLATKLRGPLPKRNSPIPKPGNSPPSRAASRKPSRCCIPSAPHSKILQSPAIE